MEHNEEQRQKHIATLEACTGVPLWLGGLSTLLVAAMGPEYITAVGVCGGVGVFGGGALMVDSVRRFVDVSKSYRRREKSETYPVE